ncbi:MAG TPA: hypothetical protein VHB79_21860 [Polyangiaceae bacterium]|nr:hypothetical protein [Polyangiaceae bacterium]
MQQAILFSFGAEMPAASEVAKVAAEICGEAPRWKLHGTGAGPWALELSVPWPERVVVELNPARQHAYIEVDPVPSYWAWVTVLALQRLGGRPSQSPPAWAGKRRNQVTWWDQLQLRRRILGR